jgi:hypothetical protein
MCRVLLNFSTSFPFEFFCCLAPLTNTNTCRLTISDSVIFNLTLLSSVAYIFLNTRTPAYYIAMDAIAESLQVRRVLH